MNGMKILGTVLAVALMIFVIAPTASAQLYPDILDGKWFKLNMSMKGYRMSGETVSPKGSGSTHAYLYMSYSSLDQSYTITTCMQDDDDDNIWWKRTGAEPIPIANIYGATYPQVWDFQDNYIEFYNGADTFDAYLTFYTKITPDKANPAKLMNASITNVSCALYADLAGGEYGCGSCSLKGSLVSVDKVPAACIPIP
jgi:hypothetical protein